MSNSELAGEKIAPIIQKDDENIADKVEATQEKLDVTVTSTARTSSSSAETRRPSRWRRLMLIISVILLFWFISSLRSASVRRPPPKVVHAHRYSKDYKFRPAASPIITEKLKDGRTRVRGAQPTFRQREHR